MLFFARMASDSFLHGSVEMKIVDAVPVVIDNRTGQVEMAPTVPPASTKSKRFRTVSESAVAARHPLVDSAAAPTTNSLRNIAGLSKLCEGSDVRVSVNGPNKKTITTFSIGHKEQQQALLSNQNEEESECDELS